MQVDIALITDERYTHSQISVRIHSDWQKKCRSAKEKLGRDQCQCKWEKPKNGSHPVADDDPSMVLQLSLT
jgi:hypothetical protein